MSGNRYMTATVIKPAVKQARKPSTKGTKGTKGNTRKAGKPVSKAPQKISSADAMSAFPDMRKVDTSDVAIAVVEHTPKGGRHAGELTHKLRLTIDGKNVQVYEDLARTLGNAFEKNLELVLQFVEYARVVPLAQ